MSATVQTVDRQDIATEIFGAIEWESPVVGYTTCPGEAMHTQASGLDGAFVVVKPANPKCRRSAGPFALCQFAQQYQYVVCSLTIENTCSTIPFWKRSRNGAIKYL